MNMPPRYIVLVRSMKHWYLPFFWPQKDQATFETKEEAADYITRMPVQKRNGYEAIEIYQRVK